MIDSDKIKVGDTVWFDSGGVIKCGDICGIIHQSGDIICEIKKRPDHKGGDNEDSESGSAVQFVDLRIIP
jgi:hypothetical protein